MLKFCFAWIKMFLAQIYVKFFGKKLIKKNLWIISEKKTEARDNGYHFFKYMQKNHSEIESIYVIQKGCSDCSKVESIGPTINFNSFKHCVYYYAAKYRVCSQIHGVRPYEEIRGIRRFSIYKREDQRHINLKHGISKDTRPDAFDFRKAGFDLYIAAAKPEYDYIKDTFDYPDKNIALTGFCRFDALHNLQEPDRMVLIMPTFREWLRTSDSSKDRASDEEMKIFMDSDYYKAYRDLLSNSSLLNIVRKYGYKINFYMHYTFQPYRYAFENLTNDVVTVCSRDQYDVQNLMKTSAMMITDFSSVFFDYAYMKKPLIYYQFDLTAYRKKHYQEGYFSYERDGFGPVITEQQNIIDCIARLFQRNCKMEEEYEKRVEKFFIPYDDHNCERVYEAILRLES